MAYTYIITHIPSGVKYYGVQYKESARPEDLGITYFSSSRTLKKLIKDEGIENFLFEVRKLFDTKEKAIEWERKFLTRVNAAKSSMWFNLSNGGAVNPGGYKLSEVTKRKMSKPKSEEHKNKLKAHLDKNRKIPEWTDEKRKELSNRMRGNTFNRGKKHPPRKKSHCENISKRLIGNQHGAGSHNLKIKICPHCGLEGSGPNMTRYHFDKCKANSLF